MKEVGDGRNLLDPPYPIRPTPHALNRLRHRQHSSQKLLGHTPVRVFWSASILTRSANTARFYNGRRWSREEWNVCAAKTMKFLRVLADLWEGTLGEDTTSITLAWHPTWHGER